MPADYYETLGVDRGADESEIKRAFRHLARELHPDVNRDDPQAEEKFKAAAEAYEVLSDPERRRTYDAFGHEGLRSGGFHSRTEGAGGFQDIFDAIFGAAGGSGGSPFDDLFGRGGPVGPAPGGDVGVRVEIELADVLEGTSEEVAFRAVVRCAHCHGNGAEPGTPILTCEECGGQGQIRRATRTPFGQMVRAAACPRCRGAGKVPETPCGTCNGDGVVAERKTYDVDIPAGIENGQRIRIAGAGHAGEPGAADGDLYVQVLVADDERFHREGSDLVTVLEVPATTAMLGASVPVETLSGEREVEVVAGTQHGDSIRLRGEGLPGLHSGRGSRRGDLHVAVKVVTPVKLSDEQREIVEQLDGTLGERNAPGGTGLFERVRRAFR